MYEASVIIDFLFRFTKKKSTMPILSKIAERINLLINNANKNKIWKLAEMDADHVAAWSKGGATDKNNCEMLCKTHNRAKGNR